MKGKLVYKVVAVDPGITTGIAIGYINEWGLMILQTGQEKYNHKGLYDGLVRQAPNAVIYERFDFRKKSRENLILYPRELIGVCELYCQQYPTAQIFGQKPSEALGGYWSDARLKRDKIYKSTTGHHANDAARHLLQWFVFGAGFKFNKMGYEPGW